MQSPTYKIHNGQDKLVIDVSKKELKRLKRHSKVLQDQINFNSILQFNPIYVHNSITKEHIELLLKIFPSKTKTALTIDSMKLTSADLFDLLQTCDALNIDYKPLTVNLKNGVKEIAEYCIENHIQYNGSLFSEEIETKKTQDLKLFLLSKTIPSIIQTKVDSIKKQSTHIAMSKNGKKLLCFAENMINIYIFKNNTFESVNKIFNVDCAGLSADGSTIMIGQLNDEQMVICWYEFSDFDLQKKGETIIKLINNKASETTSLSESLTLAAGNENNKIYFYYDDDYDRQLPIIYLNNDGKKAFLKISGQRPLCITLDNQKKFISTSKITKKYKNEESYQQIIAMSSSGVCAHMIFNNISNPEENRHYVQLDSNDTQARSSFDSREYFSSKNFNSFVDCLCLDKSAQHILKIANGNAELAEINNNKETIINLPTKTYAGSLSLNGKYAVLGGANGAVYIYDINLYQTIATIPAPINSTEKVTGEGHTVVLINGKKINETDNETDTVFNGSLSKFIPKNPAGIIALATNKNGNKIIVARTNGHIDHYSINEQLNNNIKNLDTDTRNILSSILRKQKNTNTRPTNIGSIFSNLSTNLQTIVKKHLNVRTGWGPRATWDLLNNKSVDLYYKGEAMAPYIIGATAAATGGYCAIKHWINK